VSTVQKVWDLIKQVLAFLSVATFKDQPGTFQLPVVGGLKMTKQLRMAKKPVTPNSGNLGGPGLALVICFALIQNACCAWTGTCKTVPGQIATDVIDCGKDSIKAEVAHLLPTVVAILTGGAPDWSSQLDALKIMGFEALSCAIAAAAQDLQNLMAAPGPSGVLSSTSTKAASDKHKADTWLKTYKVTFSNVEK
jgi:hypothetical protein